MIQQVLDKAHTVGCQLTQVETSENTITYMACCIGHASQLAASLFAANIWYTQDGVVLTIATELRREPYVTHLTLDEEEGHTSIYEITFDMPTDLEADRVRLQDRMVDGFFGTVKPKYVYSEWRDNVTLLIWWG